MKQTTQRVLVALSGGVDSSVAALLLKQQGYEVIGGFMKNWSLPISADNDGCGWQAEWSDAQKVARELGIPIHFFDFESDYHQLVIEPFFASYAAGLTPNPDALCNKEIKFSLFLKEADRLGCDYIATGHYSRLWRNDQIFRGSDSNKDQSYFLWAIPREILTRVLFPVGELTKSEVRAIAKKHGLLTATKKDSQGICFVGKVNLIDFLKTRLPVKPGAVRSIETGKTVGEHQGVHFYTEGQRQQLGVYGGGLPYFVARKDLKTNTLWVAPGNDHPALFSSEFVINSFNLLIDKLPAAGLSVQVRYRHPAVSCQVTESSQSVVIRLSKPVRAVTPGQSAVLYHDDLLVGGGIIQSPISFTIKSNMVTSQHDRASSSAAV